MAPPVYSQRFVNGAFAVGNNYFTFPTGYTIVIRQMDTVINAGTPGAGFFWRSPNGTIVWVGSNTQGTVQWYIGWSGRQVAHGGETWNLQVVGQSVHFTLSGYELVGAPPVLAVSHRFEPVQDHLPGVKLELAGP